MGQVGKRKAVLLSESVLWRRWGREREVSGAFSNHFSDQEGTGWTVGGPLSALWFDPFTCAV